MESAHDRSPCLQSSDTASVEEHVSQRVGGRKDFYKALTQDARPETGSAVA